MLLPISYGQSFLPEGQSSDLKITVRKYEVIQTEIHTIDNQFVYANTDIAFVGEKAGIINLEKLDEKSRKNSERAFEPIFTNKLSKFRKHNVY